MIGWKIETEIHDEKVGLQVLEINQGKKTGNFYPVGINTSVGTIECQYFPVLGSRRAVILVGSIGGNFDSPAHNLYAKLATDLNTDKISSLRVKFRYPGELAECVLDVLAAIKFLQDEGITEIALVGYSFGGAVVIQAAAIETDLVKTVVTLATQLHGTEAVTEFKNTSLLLIHGKKDKTLPFHSSEVVFELAHEPKSLTIISRATHTLNEAASQIYRHVYTWLTSQL